MKPIPVLPVLCPKAKAQLIPAKGATTPITSIDALPFDQTYIHHDGRAWVVYRKDSSPRMVVRCLTVAQAIFKARVRMPWYMR